MPSRPTPSLRTDAQQNRDRILLPALAAFSQSGDVSQQSVAVVAGVGIGTQYRHFPTREALVMEVYPSRGAATDRRRTATAGDLIPDRCPAGMDGSPGPVRHDQNRAGRGSARPAPTRGWR
jgi:hypothetical protein